MSGSEHDGPADVDGSSEAAKEAAGAAGVTSIGAAAESTGAGAAAIGARLATFGAGAVSAGADFATAAVTAAAGAEGIGARFFGGFFLGGGLAMEQNGLTGWGIRDGPGPGGIAGTEASDGPGPGGMAPTCATVAAKVCDVGQGADTGTCACGVT